MTQAPAGSRDAERLADLARESRTGDIPTNVLLLRLSALPENGSRPHSLRLARAALDPLAGGQTAELFPGVEVVLAVHTPGTAVGEPRSGVRYKVSFRSEVARPRAFIDGPTSARRDGSKSRDARVG